MRFQKRKAKCVTINCLEMDIKRRKKQNLCFFFVLFKKFVVSQQIKEGVQPHRKSDSIHCTLSIIKKP